jgi:hypothetical protein
LNISLAFLISSTKSIIECDEADKPNWNGHKHFNSKSWAPLWWLNEKQKVISNIIKDLEPPDAHVIQRLEDHCHQESPVVQDEVWNEEDNVKQYLNNPNDNIEENPCNEPEDIMKEQKEPNDPLRNEHKDFED